MWRERIREFKNGFDEDVTSFRDTLHMEGGFKDSQVLDNITIEATYVKSKGRCNFDI